MNKILLLLVALISQNCFAFSANLTDTAEDQHVTGSHNNSEPLRQFETFNVSEHQSIVDYLQKSFNLDEHFADLLRDEQATVDMVEVTDAATHMDNCQFQNGQANILDKIAKIDAQMAGIQNTDNIATYMGEILHSIQDFYSHSNYVDMYANNPLYNQAPSGLYSIPSVRFWDNQVNMQTYIDAGLISGYVFYEPKNSCGAVPDHSELAKDNTSGSFPNGSVIIPGWQMTKNMAAMTLAALDSAEFLNWAFNRWPTLPGLDYSIQHGVFQVTDANEWTLFVRPINEKNLFNLVNGYGHLLLRDFPTGERGYWDGGGSGTYSALASYRGENFVIIVNIGGELSLGCAVNTTTNTSCTHGRSLNATSGFSTINFMTPSGEYCLLVDGRGAAPDKQYAFLTATPGKCSW